jgi:AhpD family alkylhydroperoxidase
MNYPQKYDELRAGMGRYGQASPDVMTAFQALHQAGAADGLLDTRTKELIALAIAVVVRCDGCIAFHVHDAIKAGASREEIVEALDVAVLMGGGPALMYVIEALEALEQFETQAASNGNF